MEADFWHQRWHNGQIGFHKNTVNPLLARHFSRLALPAGKRVFVPLCGKSLDLGWLRRSGYHVIGAELSELAVEQLFEQLGLKPSVSRVGRCTHYRADHIDIFVGDVFDLDAATVGTVDAVYDRAALVALPPAMRERYSTHLVALTEAAPQLLICFAYDQQRMDGPPFSITPDKVEHHYAAHYELTQLDCQPVDGGLKNGTVEALEYVWLLSHGG